MTERDGEADRIAILVRELDEARARIAELERSVTERVNARIVIDDARLFEHMAEGYAYCQMLFEDGKPRDFVYLAVNSAFERLTDLRGVVGKKVSEVIPGIQETDPGLLEIYGRVSTTGTSEKFETHVDALKMWFSISVYCPEAGYFVAMFDVITARKEAERALQQKAAELSEAIRIKDVFTDVLRHDILTPISSIKLMTDAILRGESDPSKIQLLKRARQAALNLVEITENAAKLAKLAAGTAAEFTEADPVRLLRLVLPDFDHNLQEKGLSLADYSDASGFTARINPIIRDVFANLISNAIKYCPNGSRIDVGIEERGDVWLFSVQDEGPGVPDEYRQQIFRRFERLDKLGVKGSGLGLAITKQIVTLHGGEIWVEDAPGRGSRFVATFPKIPKTRPDAT